MFRNIEVKMLRQKSCEDIYKKTILKHQKSTEHLKTIKEEWVMKAQVQ